MPTKRERSPSLATPPPSTPSPNKKPNLSPGKKDTVGSPGTKKSGAWSGEELTRLYAIMCPKRQSGVKWDEVASQLSGRDAKSCQNKWTRMQSKIAKAIEEMGE